MGHGENSIMGFPGGSNSKESDCSLENLVQSLGQGDALEKGITNPLQYSCLENSTDRGVCRGTVHGVAAANTTTFVMTERYPIIHLTMIVLKIPQ